MFNITQYGSIVNIDSEDVIFHITGSYISGTSFMMANIWAEGYSWDVIYSGTYIAHIKLLEANLDTCDFRNYPWIELAHPSRIFMASGSVTTTTIYSSEDNPIAKGFVRNGNYLYYEVYNTDTGGTYSVIERDLTTDDETSIDVITENYLSGGILCYLDGRKILVRPHRAQFGSDNTEVYLVDFETSSVSTYATMEDEALSIKAFKRSSGDIWVIACGYNVDLDGYDIRFKNHTDLGSWITYSSAVDPDFWIDSEIQISGNKYAAISCHIGDTTEAIIIDFDTQILSISNAVNKPDLSDTSWDCYDSGVDVETGNIYFTYWGSKSGGIGTTDECEQWLKLIPSSGIFSESYSRISLGVVEATSTMFSIIVSDRVNAYMIQSPEGKVYLANTLNNLGTDANLFNVGNTIAHEMDDSSAFWYYSYDDQTLYQLDTSCSELQSFSPGLDVSYDFISGKLNLDSTSIYYWEEQFDIGTSIEYYRLYRLT